MAQQAPRIRFGPFVLDRREQRLLRDGSPVELTQRSLAVLDALLSRPGEVVSREDLVALVWPRTVVTDAAVAKRVQEVRGVLDDDHRAPRYIQTVHRRGFRFIGAFEQEPERSEFVGRDAPLQHLHAAMDAVRARRRTTVFVTGEAGIGKTALVRRFLNELGDDAIVIEGACTRYGEGQPFLPVATALAELTHRPSEAAVLRAVAPSWSQLVPGLGAAAPATGQQRLFLELSAAFDAVTQERALVLVVEDLHWCDPSSLALLDYLARKATPARLLLLTTLRDGVLSGREPLQALLAGRIGRQGCVEIHLSRLLTRDVERYLAARFGESLSKSLADPVHKRTNGLPLFVAWLGTWMHDSLATEAADLDTLDRGMPDSLARLFDLELAGLAAEELALLEAASVVGESFTAPAVAGVAAMPTGDVERGCRALLRGSSVLVPVGGPLSQTFAFAHALLRDALYTRIDAPRRKALHGVCATMLAYNMANTVATNAANDAGTIAFHFAAAGKPLEAAEHYVRAGRDAIATHGLIEARNYFEAAVSALEHEPPRASVPEGSDPSGTAPPGARDAEVNALLGLGHCLVATTGYAAPRVHAVYERVCRLTENACDPARRYAALNGLATYLLMRGRLADAAAYDTSMFAAAQATHDPVLRARALAHRGERYFYEGRTHEAAADFREAGALVGARGVDPVAWTNWTHISITVHEYLAQIACDQCRFGEALAHLDDMFYALERNPHPYSECMAHFFAALTRLAREDLADVGEHVRRMVELASDHGFYDLGIWAGIIEGHLECRAGRIDAGLARLREGLTALDGSGTVLARTAVMLLLAEALADRGDHRAALDLLDETENLIAQTGERCREPVLHIVRARTLEAAGASRPGVVACFERALSCAQVLDSRLWALRAMTHLIDVGAGDAATLERWVDGLDDAGSPGVLVAARAALQHAGRTS